MIVVRRAGVSGTGVHGRRRARPAARPGDRPDRQLVEPGALRQADRPPVGPEDRPGPPGGPPGEVPGRPRPTTRRSSTSSSGTSLGVALLLWLDRRYTFRPPALFALYVSYYCFGRFFEELLRIDPSHHFAGLRINAWVSIVLFVGSTAFFIWWQVLGRGGSGREGAPKVRAAASARPGAAEDDRPERPRPVAGLACRGWQRRPTVGELDLDLDAFEGPFDLLLTLVLREELPLREVDLAEIVIAFVERLAERDELDLDACGEFLVLISALLELKARGAVPRRGRRARRARAGGSPPRSSRGGWPSTGAPRRLRPGSPSASTPHATASSGSVPRRSHRRGPSPSSPRSRRSSSPTRSVRSPSSRRSCRPRTWRSRFPPVSQFVERWRSLLKRRTRLDFDQEVAGLSRVEVAVAFLALLELAKQRELAIAQAAPFAPIRIARPSAERSLAVDRPLRLVASNPVDELARTIEALLVVASTAALRGGARRRDAATSPERVTDALELLAERYREGRSGIVLEHVAGGFAFRASREAAEACARLFERPVERGLSRRGARDARDRRLPRPVHPARDHPHPRRQRRRGRLRPRRARPARRVRPRQGVRGRPVRDDARCSSASSGSSRWPSSRGSTTSAPTRPRSASASRPSPRSARPRRRVV